MWVFDLLIYLFVSVSLCLVYLFTNICMIILVDWVYKLADWMRK